MKYPNKALISSHAGRYVRFENQAVSKHAMLFYRLLQNKSRLNFFITVAHYRGAGKSLARPGRQ